jgi:hypothetical protein
MGVLATTLYSRGGVFWRFLSFALSINFSAESVHATDLSLRQASAIHTYIYMVSTVISLLPFLSSYAKPVRACTWPRAPPCAWLSQIGAKSMSRAHCATEHMMRYVMYLWRYCAYRAHTIECHMYTHYTMQPLQALITFEPAVLHFCCKIANTQRGKLLWKVM